MTIRNLTSAQFNKIARLISKKETLLARLAVIDRQLSKFEGGETEVVSEAPIAKSKSEGPAVAVKRRGRKRSIGKLKINILKVLQTVGPKGAKVGDIAKKLGVKPGNVFSWFYTTGKKNASIKKVGEARYALAK
jgi:hypothetical protein